jgi:tRNA-dihydrouridine synthase
MAGMTDTAFRRLVKRQGGCGLVVSEMVSSEGLVRGIDRTLEYAEYTEEERPVSIQILRGRPGKDGRRRADHRAARRRRRRRQHGLSGAQDRQAHAGAA